MPRKRVVSFMEMGSWVGEWSAELSLSPRRRRPGCFAAAGSLVVKTFVNPYRAIEIGTSGFGTARARVICVRCKLNLYGRMDVGAEDILYFVFLRVLERFRVSRFSIHLHCYRAQSLVLL